MLFKVLGSQSYTDTGAQADAVRAAGEALSVEICKEGFVLLKNEDDILPLSQTKLNIFGDDAYNFVYGGSGSAGADQSGAQTLFDAFSEANIEYNKDLDSAYRELKVGSGASDGSIKDMLFSYLFGKKEQIDWTLPDGLTFPVRTSAMTPHPREPGEPTQSTASAES